MSTEGLKTAAAAVLLAVAKEIEKQAKDSLPELQEGETIRRESYRNGVYYRETSLATYLYDFRQREYREA